jgi:hypothetical protein
VRRQQGQYPSPHIAQLNESTTRISKPYIPKPLTPHPNVPFYFALPSALPSAFLHRNYIYFGLQLLQVPTGAPFIVRYVLLLSVRHLIRTPPTKPPPFFFSYTAISPLTPYLRGSRAATNTTGTPYMSPSSQSRSMLTSRLYSITVHAVRLAWGDVPIEHFHLH